ncbi:MAG: efflux RND transporter periplasmic adaptor subunit [Bacteroidales bacterium]|nr:efflux RND transporter periplasmic adaptor subunit [Bacteroidales bacterium]
MKQIIKSVGTAALCLLGAILVVGCAGKKEEQGAAKETVRGVTIMAASAKDVEQVEIFTGTVEGFNTNNISPQSPGRIERINVEVGDRVYKGQRLAQMDASNLNQVRLQMENNKMEFERTKQLFEIGGASQSEYDARKMAYEVSQTTYNNLAVNTYLNSPISGVVTARNYDAGDMFSGAMPLFTVEQIRPVKIKVNAPEGLFGQIKKGQSVNIKLDVYPDEVFEGKVHLVYPSISAASRTFPIEITIENSNERVRPGMFARAIFVYAVEHNVVVPDVAVVKQMGSGDHYVYTVVDNKVVFNKVKLGQLIGTEYEIKSGLKEGDMIIVEGQGRVVNGQQVNATVGEPASFVPDNLVDKN